MIRVIPRPQIYVKGFPGYVVMNVGETVTLWVANIFNPSVIDLTLATNLPFDKVSDYEYILTPDEPGFFTVSISAVEKAKDKPKSQPSKSMLIIVV